MSWDEDEAEAVELCVPIEGTGRGTFSVPDGPGEREVIWLQRQVNEADALNCELHLKAVRAFIEQGGNENAVNQEAAKLADRLMADTPWYEWPDEGPVDLSLLWEKP